MKAKALIDIDIDDNDPTLCGRCVQGWTDGGKPQCEIFGSILLSENGDRKK